MVRSLRTEVSGPCPRSRSKRALSLAEREEISRGIAAKQSMRSIAARLGRAASTVSREISRNGGYDKYRALEADAQAWERACRPKPCRLVDNPKLCGLVEDKLRQGWAPEQIAGGLKLEYPDDASLHVSHETIYRSLFIQGPWGFEERTDSVSADKTHDSTVCKSDPERPWKGTNRGHDLYP